MGARITPVGGEADGAPSGRRDVSGHALQARGKGGMKAEAEMAARVRRYGTVTRRRAKCSTTKEIGTTSDGGRRANTINLAETETKRKKTARYIRSSRKEGEDHGTARSHTIPGDQAR